MKLSSLLPRHFSPESSNDPEVTSISSDSRDVIPGTLFFALSGTRLEGSNFIKQAIAKGACAIVTQKEISSLLDIPIPVLYAKNASSLLGECAYHLAAPLPEHLVAITGTNGKTSTADFLRQIWALEGRKSASIGTLGIKSSEGDFQGSHTTPPAPLLAKYLHQLKKTHIDHVALEASSHGLAQNRLHGLHFEAAGFSSFSRDHLDYHKDEADYLSAKLSLFEDLLKADAPIVASTACGQDVLQKLEAIAQRTGNSLRTVGENGNFIHLMDIRPLPHGQQLHLSIFNQKPFLLNLPLSGLFQARNALLAAALACPANVTNDGVHAILNLLTGLKPISGRAELAGHTQNGGTVYIDYAHTPDALERIIEALRPHLAENGRLFIIFGAGGNRDAGKRPLMGKASCLADMSIITDDNPRFEDPAQIRREICSGCPNGVEIPDRREAIRFGLKQLQKGDILLIAGKGHEKGQEINGKILPFDDLAIARQEGALLDEAS